METRLLLGVLGVALLCCGAAPGALDAPDTTLVLGGPDRWDGRFETAAGEPAWHGWTHEDLYRDLYGDPHWQISAFMAPAGQYAMWCGTVFPDGDRGYGNHWNEALVFTHTATSGAIASSVQWSGTLRVDTEPGYDFVYLEVNRGGYWWPLQTYDGLHTHHFAETVVVAPDDYVGPGHDRLELRVRFTADGAWSDEDGLLDTNGACQCDDVTVIVDGVVVDHEDFEDQASRRWAPAHAVVVGDFTALWSGLDDIDPDPAHQNGSWQVAFIDDGVVVPGTGGTPCDSWCYGPDGWCYNLTAGLDGWGMDVAQIGWGNGGVWNAVVSPPLSWPEGADAGELAWDVYAHMQTYECGVTTYGWTVRSTTVADSTALDAAPWSPTRWSCLGSMPAGPGYFRLAKRLDDLLLPGTRWLQVRFEAYEGGPWCWGQYVDDPTPAPYFDNVAVRAWRAVTAAPPDAAVVSLAAAPNPFNPRVTLRWSQPIAGRIDLAVYDARGRLVRTLVAEDRPAGPETVAWDGRDDAGAGVAAGVYVARLQTTAGS